MFFLLSPENGKWEFSCTGDPLKSQEFLHTNYTKIIIYTVFESLHRLKNFQTLDVGGGIFTALSLEIQFKHTFNSSIL
jgi:hypothetical protein